MVTLADVRILTFFVGPGEAPGGDRTILGQKCNDPWRVFWARSSACEPPGPGGGQKAPRSMKNDIFLHLSAAMKKVSISGGKQRSAVPNSHFGRRRNVYKTWFQHRGVKITGVLYIKHVFCHFLSTFWYPIGINTGINTEARARVYAATNSDEG